MAQQPSIATIVATAQPSEMCSQVLPIVRANPAAAAELVAAVSMNPGMAIPICGCLARIEQVLASTNPTGAATVSRIVSNSPLACQGNQNVTYVTYAERSFGFGPSGGDTPGVVSPSKP